MELKTRLRPPAACLLLALACAPSALAQRFITVASTTSTEQSGLFGHILPDLRAEDGNRGTRRGARHGPGARPRAPRRCRRGLRAREGGRRAVPERRTRRAALPVMYNDFVIIGPKADPAGIAGGNDTLDAFRKIKRAGARRSCRAATAAARTSPRSTSGRWRASTSRRRKARGIARQGKAWDRR